MKNGSIISMCGIILNLSKDWYHFVIFSFQSAFLVCTDITLAFGFNYIIFTTLRK